MIEQKTSIVESQKTLYAVVDIETSGGNPRRNRITEIAIILFDGENIVDSFSSLVNPEQRIVYKISQITGITDQMVANAPKFYEVAKRVVEMTEGAIFVAHNVRFDYGAIQKEFRRLGYTFSRKQLCTIRLSKRVFPNLKSYSLGALCKHFNITNAQAHRAESDARATTELLQKLLAKIEDDSVEKVVKEELKNISIPQNLPREVVDSLPEEPGVYYFRDQDNRVLYVGKSKQIRTRILSHFQNKESRFLRLQEQVYNITFELTGSELIALLRENDEIKRILPPFNRAQRRRRFLYGIFEQVDEEGFIRLQVRRLRKNEKELAIALFPHRRSADRSLERKIEQFELCNKLCGLEGGGGGPCFSVYLHKCKGACCGKEEPETYNARIEQAKSAWSYGKANFAVIGYGRDYGESSIVCVENGMYKGYGYFDEKHLSEPLSELLRFVEPKLETPDVRNIIRRFIQKHPKKVREFLSNTP